MLKMRESWTDERLDDFAKHVDHRFDEVDRQFDGVNRRLDRVEGGLGNLQRTLLQIAGSTIATLIAGFAGVIATQL